MTGLIIEGGARRGIFTAGITDCLLENKIHFDYVAGVSAGAEVAGAGIVIEKAYQGGGNLVRDMGVRVESLAKIKSISKKDGIVFCKQ